MMDLNVKAILYVLITGALLLLVADYLLSTRNAIRRNAKVFSVGGLLVLAESFVDWLCKPLSPGETLDVGTLSHVLWPDGWAGIVMLIVGGTLWLLELKRENAHDLQ